MLKDGWMRDAPLAEYAEYVKQAVQHKAEQIKEESL